ncbi:MAG: T9SS C-terminal target domain-containing protein [Pyrinomonadaceae bacterium]
MLLLAVGMAIQACAQVTNSAQIKTVNSLGNGYSISLEPVTIPGFSGLHSFAGAQLEGKWVLIGGRTDGLHRRQPFASFAASGNNANIVVIDPESKQRWIATVNDLPPALDEQLQSTNMQFIQRGKMLYLIGGYGYSKSLGNHITHNKLTAVKVDCLKAAIQKSGSMTACFRQISDPAFALTGGQIGRIGDDYFLVGGQKFDGRYNPMGPDHGPGFSQQYGEQIRKFRINDDQTLLSVNKVDVTTDNENLHRRDFSMLPQIFPNNEVGFTVFSGVFQPTANIPFTNTVNVVSDRIKVEGKFTQYLNHYHSAKVALYDATEQRMSNIFFGGMSQYEETAGVLTKNNDVPFTKVIGNVTREKDGKMSETKMGEMPGFFGAGAEFFIDPKIPIYESEIVKLNEIKGDRVLLGHIVGGISSTRKSIFFSNSGSESEASKMVFKVWLTKIDRRSAGETK